MEKHEEQTQTASTQTTKLLDLSLLGECSFIHYSLFSLFATLGFFAPQLFVIELSVSRGVERSRAAYTLSVVAVAEIFGCFAVCLVLSRVQRQEAPGAARIHSSDGPGAGSLYPGVGVLGPGGVLRLLWVSAWHSGINTCTPACRGRCGRHGKDGVSHRDLCLHTELCWAGWSTTGRCFGGPDSELRLRVLLLCGRYGTRGYVPGTGTTSQDRPALLQQEGPTEQHRTPADGAREPYTSV
ncbi:hypothetical protein UPYG_G00134550 [Umbra pygmaea]|uniref:Uncharacterized protein n=1 Tax=Umbra pygmaea TaxID=75934 RepID=A0ABD0WYD7_UMBPY